MSLCACEPKCVSMVTKNPTDNLTKTPQGMFRLDIRKHFLTKGVSKHWHRPHGELVDAPSLSVVKSHWLNALNNML